MSKYGWIITKDHLANNFDDLKSTVGIMGPADLNKNIEGLLKKKWGLEFKLFDDDGELYYEGRFLSEHGLKDDAIMSPLDDFGGPDSGCTYIQYFIDGKWETI